MGRKDQEVSLTTAAIYLRQSLDKTGDELGIERQRRECERLCAARGYEIAETVVDNSVSASKHGRPGYGRLLELIERRQVDVVVILRIDRLLRLNDELEQLVGLSERSGVKVATVEGDIDLSTPSGRLVARVLVSVARAEMEVKSARHKLANQQKARAGKPHSGRRPYGYEPDMVTVRESEAAVLRAAADKVIGGWSCNETVYWMNKQGYRTAGGKLWHPVGLRDTLQKKRYVGIRSYNGVEYQGNWQPIFDAETWERLQLTFRLRSERWADRPDPLPIPRRYLLTGLLFCGKCGLPLNGNLKRDHAGTPPRRTYQCGAHKYTEVRGCRGICRSAEPLEHFVTECLLYRLETPELDQILATAGDSDRMLADLLSDRQLQQARLEALVDDYATGLLTKAQFSRAKSTAETELQRINDELGRASRERSGAALLPKGSAVREAWHQAESDEWRRQLLRLVIKRIVVNPGLKKPDYKLPDGRVLKFDPSLIQIAWLA